MLTVLACQEPGEIGLTPTTPVGVFLSDTFTVRRSTILLDSVQTNDLSGMPVGRYVDLIFGKGRATSFAKLGILNQFIVTETGTTTTIPANRVTYDSTRIVVGYGSAFPAYYGDTTVVQTLGLHRLTEDIRTGGYDIRNSVGYEPQPIVRFTFQPRPFTRDSLNLSAKLPDAIGRELFAQYDTDAGKDATKFRDLGIKGYAFVSTTATERAAVINYLPGSYIDVYFHVNGETSARIQRFYFNGPRFTNLVVDRTGTPLANLRAGQVLASTATNGRSFVQPFAGVTTKLEFPGLLNLEQNRRVAINRAELVITPTQPESSAPVGGNVPFLLTLGEANGFSVARTSPNRVYQLVPDFPGVAVNRSEATFYASQVAFYNSRTKNYTFNMTGYIQSIMAGTTPNNGLLILTPGSSNVAPVQNGVLSLIAQTQSINDRLTRMILDGNASVKLVVFYTSSN